MDSNDLEKLAEEIVTKIQGSPQSDFYIPPKAHYDQHQNLEAMYKDWVRIRDTFNKVILGFLIMGLVISIFIGFLASIVKDIPEWWKGH